MRLRILLVAFGVFVSLVPAQPVRDTFWLVMDDSVRIDCTMFTPPDSPPVGGFPAVVFVHGLGSDKSSCEATAQTYAGRGYVTLAYSVRGQGRSTGLGTLFSWRERQDLAAVVAWLAARPNVNDTLLGVQGVSQGAFHSWFAGVDNLPGVRAVEPDNAVPHVEESFADNNCYNITITAGLNDCPTVRLDTVAMPLGRLMRADQYDSVVALMSDGRSFDSTQVAASSAAYMFAGAWHDHCFYFTRFSGIMSVAPPHSIMYLGTGNHFSDTSRVEFYFRDTLRQRFFAERLKGQNCGLDTVGPWVFVLGPRWNHVEYQTWPPAGLTSIDYWLHSDGSLNEELPAGDSAARLELRRMNPAYTWDSAVHDLFASVRQSFARNRTAFRTLPLDQPVTLLGAPWVDAWFKGPAPKKQLTLQLYDEPPSGPPTYLAQVSLGVRDNPDSTVWDHVAGRMSPIGWNIPAGHRLRVDWAAVNVTLTDTSLWWIPYWDADGWLTLGLDSLHPSRTSLPVLLASGIAQSQPVAAPTPRPAAIVHGVLELAASAHSRVVDSYLLHDAAGRTVMTLKPGANDVRALAPGVYFVREGGGKGVQGGVRIRRVLIAK
jgi:predicted acyl esterase